MAERFRNGQADIAVLDRAVERILRAKFRMGLFERPFALEGEKLCPVFHREADRDITLQSARESIILLKNKGNILPISKASHYAEALGIAEDADVILLTLGGKNGSGSIASMGEGVDGADINLPTCQEGFIRRAAQVGKPLVGLHFDGRPISSDASDQCLDAILECWNPAERGAEAVADILLGVISP